MNMDSMKFLKTSFYLSLINTLFFFCHLYKHGQMFFHCLIKNGACDKQLCRSTAGKHTFFLEKRGGHS
ncbi:hypothetical protein FHS56_000816 [Thermonema lapsum]|uniref:Uncharacterized protein n=1 Tax=Thermonema lapsum TaxID=28195 RepID=A0A846MPM5_9BACT|nr:hypothetical protein [Thermonema lapsum]